MPHLAAARIALLSIVALLALAGPADAALHLQKVGNFSEPIIVTAAPGDYARLYVVERSGVIRVVRGGAVLPTPFADISGVVDTTGERGLLSIAFAPDFQRSRLLYAYYNDSSGDIHVDQLRAPSADRADSSYRRSTITIDHPTTTNHNGGTARFGPDGYLYLATGDGAVDSNTAQSTTSLLGKVLRIRPTPGGGHTSPAGNPFHNEVWSIGLRNPFRFSFDRATGDLALGDVGAASSEEINFAPASSQRGRGWNYGWPTCEGSCSAGFRNPVIEKPNPPWETINAGVVVRDPSLPSLNGRFLYGDTYGGQLYSAVLRQPRATDDRALPFKLEGVAGLGEDAAGCVYAASLSGAVYRFVETSNRIPCPRPAPAADSVPPRLRVRVPKHQRVRRRRGTIAYARCSERCRVVMSGRVRIGRRSYKLRKVTKRAEAHRRIKLRIKLTRRASRALRRALQRRRPAKVRVALRARDRAGNRSRLLKRTVRVRR